MASAKTEMEFEDILEEVGGYGKYQKRLILYFLVPSAAVLPWFTMNILFLVFTPDHWCYVPEVSNSNLSLHAQRSLVAPANEACIMYDLNYTQLLESRDFRIGNDTPRIACRDGWQYDPTHFQETAASKWNMVCGNGHHSSLVMMMTNVGSIIGTPIYGTLSDRLGRKPVFFIVILVTAITSITSVLMTDFTAFLVLRTINGSLMPSVFQLPFIILLELVGPTMRTRMNGISNVAWTMGLCTLPLIAYYSKHWVTFGLFTSSVSVLMFLYWKILPESPRWLISREKYAEASIILNRIADTNKMNIDPVELRLKIQRLGERIKKEKELGTGSNTSLNLFRFPNIRKKFFIISLCWVADIFGYYGLQINVANLGGNPFLTFFLLALVEVPGFLFSWFFMETWGRRWCSVISLSLTAAACLCAAVMPEDLPFALIACSLIGKFGTSAAFMAVYQQGSELYPTTIRAIGMGLSGTCAGIANIIVPYVIFLAVYGKNIPFLVIGVINLIAGFAATLLPETLNEILPQTLQDAELFGKDQDLFPCSRKRASCAPSDAEHSPKLLMPLT